MICATQEVLNPPELRKTAFPLEISLPFLYLDTVTRVISPEQIWTCYPSPMF